MFSHTSDRPGHANEHPLQSLLIVGLFVVSCLWPKPASAQTPITVHVFTATDPSGLVDAAATDRVKAVDDVKKRLSQNKAVALVPSAADARVSIEVVGAGWQATDAKSVSTVVPVNGVAIVTPPATLSAFTGRIVLTSGTFSTEFTAGLGPFGRSVGENLARKVEGWVKDNAATLTK